MREVDILETGRIQQAIEQRIDTGNRSKFDGFEFLDEVLHVARIGNQIHQRTIFHERQAVGS